MSTNQWSMKFNDTKERCIELVEAETAPSGEGVAFEAARAEILLRLAKLPGPNAHVDAHGAGTHSPTIFVGEGDPLKTYPSSKPAEELKAERAERKEEEAVQAEEERTRLEAKADADATDDHTLESMMASEDARTEDRVR